MVSANQQASFNIEKNTAIIYLFVTFGDVLRLQFMILGVMHIA